MSALLIIVLLVTAVMAAAPAIIERSWARFFIGSFICAFGILLPIFFFLFSAFLLPDWKGGCCHGWIDCFCVGKLALTPLVLIASAALYELEVRRVPPPASKRVVSGFFFGAIVSSVCLVFGLFTVETSMQPWLIVPFYVAIWYVVRAVGLIQTSGIKLQAYIIDFCVMLPFWIGGLFWARRVYSTLPDTAPSCFVVTAASRGHRELVGPFVLIQRNGVARSANRQLLTFWEFETFLQANVPRLHAAFRRCYNVLGPVVARRITTPWLADALYLALKPAELIAAFVIRAGAADIFQRPELAIANF
jgi:hypothetical protein